jgi:3-hydroxybutyryl-CoA dehydrogenase
VSGADSAAVEGAALATDAPVAVIGAGTMGAGIAHGAAAAGHPVLLYDAREGAARNAIDAIAADLARQVARGKLSRDAADALTGRIRALSSLAEAAPAKLVIEAILEDLAAKRALFAQLEGIVAADAVLATNTSSLSVTALAGGLRHPGRCVGIHFFNPAPVMKLVEIVRPLTASDAVVQTAFHTAQAWGKRALIVPSTPGFIVNRVARPFYAEALRTLTAPAGVPDIDAALTESGGFRMGPFQVMDLIGNDVNAAVTRSVFDAFAYERRFAPSLAQQALVDAGWLGRKSGRGFYDYTPGAPAPAARDAEPGPRPSRVVVHGDLGVAAPLFELAVAHGLAPRRAEGAEPFIDVDGIAVRLTDGALAAEQSRLRPTVLFDLALDYAACSRVVIAAAPGGDDAAAAAAGFFQTLGKRVSILPDFPGLVVMRTVAALSNEAAGMLAEGVSDDAIDLAMTLGTNYPFGPIGWARRIGWERLLTVLENLSRVLGAERYQPALMLRRLALAGSTSGA